MIGNRWSLLVLAVLVAFADAGPVLAADDEVAARVQQMYVRARDRHFPGVAELDPRAARALAESTAVVWLDVRTARERRVSVIENAIDQSTYRQNATRLAGHPVIVYCTIGHRSGLVTRELRAEGIDAHNLAGGILAWIHAEGALVDPTSGLDTHDVHVYGRRWNLVPEGWRSQW